MKFSRPVHIFLNLIIYPALSLVTVGLIFQLLDRITSRPLFLTLIVIAILTPGVVLALGIYFIVRRRKWWMFIVVPLASTLVWTGLALAMNSFLPKDGSNYSLSDAGLFALIYWPCVLIVSAMIVWFKSGKRLRLSLKKKVAV